jgi:hypothetical protein
MKKISVPLDSLTIEILEMIAEKKDCTSSDVVKAIIDAWLRDRANEIAEKISKK